MDYNVHKICRVCLKEGALTSIYSTEFAMMPSMMLMLCAKVRVYQKDGLPEVICSNCIYRLGAAYHFKQECENSDMRLRQYLSLPDKGYGVCDAETNTELNWCKSDKLHTIHSHDIDHDTDDFERDDIDVKLTKRKTKRRYRYQRKPPEQHKKRGPKPVPKLPPTCYECNKTFKCTAQLQMHIRTHTGEKPFACRYCPRRFAQKYNSQIHERTHTGDKPFQCEICSKQFSALGNFQVHLKIHTGIRDQHCPICQKSFYTVGDLSKHMITHTGIKNHHCDICGKAFSRRRDMQSHKRKLHTLTNLTERSEDDEIVDAVVNDGFKCPECDKEFESASNLSIHFRSHSSNNLLNFPVTNITQMPQPLSAPTHSADVHHYHHAHTITRPLAPVHSHHESTMHSRTHLQDMNTSALQSDASTAAGMSMAHMLSVAPPLHASHPAHVLPSGVSPTGQRTLAMMHSAQRLHPF